MRKLDGLGFMGATLVLVACQAAPPAVSTGDDGSVAEPPTGFGGAGGMGRHDPPTAGGGHEQGGAPPGPGVGGGDHAPPLRWSIFVVDVGQGDATVVVGPEVEGRRRTLVVDAGDRHPDGGAIVSDLLFDEGVDAVDWVVLSHFDGDHAGGFVTISSSTSLLWQDADCTPSAWFPTRGIFDQGIDGNSTQTSLEWTRCTTELSASLEVPRFAVAGGDELGTELDFGGGVTATIVAGDGYVIDQPERVASVNTPNERSIALWLHDQEGFDFLVTGDLIGRVAGAENARVESALADALSHRGVDLEVLRVGHHGAGNATDPEFVTALAPEVALISVGDDQASNYHHPRCSTYDSLADAQVAWTLQTERGFPDCTTLSLEPWVVDGTIRIDVTGADYRIANHGSTSPAHGGPSREVELQCDLRGCSAR